MRLTGPLDAPAREILSKGLQGYFTERLLGDVVRRLVPGAKGGDAAPDPALRGSTGSGRNQPTPAAPGTAPATPKAPTVENALKDILKKGLGR
ncbi:MAG: hypothetical protein EXQ96_05410 [Alphaproteobacteria bacterium]|nr:hypothetical protein [Alphaproteobacteria bacterium]